MDARVLKENILTLGVAGAIAGAVACYLIIYLAQATVPPLPRYFMPVWSQIHLVTIVIAVATCVV